jgi:UDPglucose--hexose-1-phosphate uridylyltransferase
MRACPRRSGVSELRWNPLLGEWVVRSSPPPEPSTGVCPYCPTKPDGPTTEVPESTYDIVVLEDRRASLRPEPDEPSVEGSILYPIRPARGVCEVVLFTPDHDATLAGQSVEKIYNLVRVWTDRFLALETLEFVKYVLATGGDNAGTHPRSSIRAYSFVPSRVEREIEMSRVHEAETSRCLLCDVASEERLGGRRVVAENESFVAYVPFFARWPFEVHVCPIRHVQALPDLSDREQRDLAAILKTVLTAYDRLFGGPSTYAMTLHQRPTDGQRYGFYHFHVEFHPCTEGEEAGAGVLVNTVLPRDAAARLSTRSTPSDSS